MSDEELPEDVRELVRLYIHSVAQLEALLFFRKSIGESWNVETLAARLYAGKGEMANALASLERDGFLRSDEESYTFAPQKELKLVVDSLAKAYSRHLIPITNIIHSKPRRIQEFSDAFRIRKD
ncbi:hypothetical protein QY049_24170 [Bradyrhizobium sp. WYCCWR 13022]|uniref:hypothetical protein n=1 Tax=unclassified Bradyrhizobium TaxID=2631580 RepID=UPI00263A7984|nr:hypothetical protein [Bradyrhizobium sp. WYCCWR 13022]MDN4986256.1 hypothetical protein [Bradyrhizobium sp. WYCCWR 13022]